MTVHSPPPPVVLTIAGSDSSGGAGLQADLKTFAAHGVYGASVVTAITAQNTRAVSAVFPVPGTMIAAQLDAIFRDLDVKAIKIGMTGTGEAISALVAALKVWTGPPVVLDPVMVAGSGDALLADEAFTALRDRLLPCATLITPNLPEAARLLGTDEARSVQDMQTQIKALARLGARAVLLKGGHLPGNTAIDLFYDGAQLHKFERPRVATPHTHGSGCTMASAIAARLALGDDMLNAVARAKAYISAAIRHAATLEVGHGSGPLHHFHALWPRLHLAG